MLPEGPMQQEKQLCMWCFSIPSSSVCWYHVYLNTPLAAAGNVRIGQAEWKIFHDQLMEEWQEGAISLYCCHIIPGWLQEAFRDGHSCGWKQGSCRGWYSMARIPSSTGVSSSTPILLDKTYNQLSHLKLDLPLPMVTTHSMLCLAVVLHVTHWADVTWCLS